MPWIPAGSIILNIFLMCEFPAPFLTVTWYVRCGIGKSISEGSLRIHCSIKCGLRPGCNKCSDAAAAPAQQLGCLKLSINAHVLGLNVYLLSVSLPASAV